MFLNKEFFTGTKKKKEKKKRSNIRDSDFWIFLSFSVISLKESCRLAEVTTMYIKSVATQGCDVCQYELGSISNFSLLILQKQTNKMGNIYIDNQKSSQLKYYPLNTTIIFKAHLLLIIVIDTHKLIPNHEKLYLIPLSHTYSRNKLSSKIRKQKKHSTQMQCTQFWLVISYFNDLI